MTKEVLKQALDVLKSKDTWGSSIREAKEDAIKALEEALETKDAPVAWGMKKDGVILDVICPAEHEHEEGSYTTPLYISSQRTWVGLTDEQILHFVDTHVGAPSMDYPLDNSDWINFARAIEAAHGIKETP